MFRPTADDKLRNIMEDMIVLYHNVDDVLAAAYVKQSEQVL